MTNLKVVLVTGGTGYIGSHVILALLSHGGFMPIALDNLANSYLESLERIRELTGVAVPFFKVDLFRQPRLLEDLFRGNALFQRVSAVIHCAGLKAVGESVLDPLRYYENNFVGSMNLLNAIKTFRLSPEAPEGLKGASTFSFIFSSSAMVYGHSKIIPIPEDQPCAATSPYGMSKFAVEKLLKDFADSVARLSTDGFAEFKCINLRYFNPVGAHPSGRLGEHPQGIPNNLMPYLGQVACGKLDTLSVFGDDYKTIDGTGVRDYIHIMDLADGHVAALKYLSASLDPGSNCFDCNLGLGIGYSVLQMIQAFEKASEKKIPYKIVGRRYGDVDTLVALPEKAKQLMAWSPKYDLEDICRDFWNWLQLNPNGYT